MSVCIISYSQDRHVQHLKKFIATRSLYCVYSDQPKTFPSLDIVNEKSSFSKNNTHVRALWFRKPGHATTSSLVTNQVNVRLGRKYKAEEVLDFLRAYSILAESRGVFVVNCEDAKLNANSKINQLIVAEQLGFTIPRTLVTTSTIEVKKYLDECDTLTVISKPMKAKVVSHDEYYVASLAREVEKTEIETYISTRDTIDYPLFLQEKINKVVDLRVTVIGNQIFGCQIETRNDTKAEVNWLLTKERKYTAAQLPVEVERKCIDYLRHFKLQYGAFDFVVNELGEYVFLECNTNGEYLWVELETGLPLSQAMANLLLSPQKYGL